MWPVAAAEPRLKDVLARLESYLTAYEAQLSTLVAEEQYVQWSGREGSESKRRTLTSDFGFLRLPGRLEWLGLRDTFSVDGEPVPDRQGRLDRLLVEGAAGQQDLARRIVEENARYNIGIVARTINVPMLALDYLESRNRWRLSLHRRGEEEVEGRKAWAISFEEKERPTLVRTTRGRSQPVHGLVWVAPADGVVLRTEIAFDRLGDDSPAARITVRYRQEAALGMLVPFEMRERYQMESGTSARTEIGAVATYAKFRQFRASGRIVSPQ